MKAWDITLIVMYTLYLSTKETKNTNICIDNFEESF